MSPSARAWLRPGALALAGALCMSLGIGCKQPEKPELKVFDEHATPAEAEALAALAPPWPPPEQTELDNGLLVHWLVEEENSALNLRLLIPFARSPATGAAALDESAALAAAAQTLALELERRMRRYQGRVELVQKPGRFELAVQTQTRHFASVMPALGRLLGRPASARTLELGRRYLEGGAPSPGPEARAVNELSARLLGVDPASARVEPERVAALDEASLQRAWDRVRDPQRAVLVVHSGLASGTAAVTEGLDALSTSWRAEDDRGATREDEEGGAHSRLAIPTKAVKPTGAFLLRESEETALSPVVFVEMPGNKQPELLFGRVVPTPTSKERSMARLSQRVLQESIDVRLSISGGQAILLVRAPVRLGSGGAGEENAGKSFLDVIYNDSKKKDDDAPAKSKLLRSVERFHRGVRRRQTSQRLFQAAELWLGARMVAASLTGEDWTALWSDAIDLSVRDADIAGALARDAREMLATSPDALLKWQERWLNPASGEPGWMWVLAGDPELLSTELDRLGVKIERVR